MARIYIVRHGHAAAGFAEAVDPELDALGREQAERVAAQLAPLGSLPILTSPLMRARQTAEPLAVRWRCSPTIEDAIGEIPSPSNDLAERAVWLGEVVTGTWQDAGPELVTWRKRLLAAITAGQSDTVLFSHYVAINAVVGEAINDSRLVVFSPDNCSVTIVETAAGGLRLVQMGAAALTRVN